MNGFISHCRQNGKTKRNRAKHPRPRYFIKNGKIANKVNKRKSPNLQNKKGNDRKERLTGPGVRSNEALPKRTINSVINGKERATAIKNMDRKCTHLIFSSEG